MIHSTWRRGRRLYLTACILLCQGLLLIGCRTRQQYQVLTVSPDTEAETQLSGETEGIKQTIRVYVCGAVERSGVYELEDGARAADALEMAGGFSQDADREWVNLARRVADGERLAFYTLEQTEIMKEEGILCAEEQGPVTGRISLSGEEQTGEGRISSESGLINLNTATKEELLSLPGIGESKAKAIMLYRETQGPFQSIEEIMQIRGIKESVFQSIRDLITV